LSAARENEAIATDQDAYGQRYVVDFVMRRGGREATVRSSWIIRTLEDFPRLTSCFVLWGFTMKLLDVVALTEDIPEKRLLRGQVGTLVEQLTPEVFEVEFSYINGRTYALIALPKTRLMVLHHQPADRAA
jgi:hypothetical protein